MAVLVLRPAALEAALPHLPALAETEAILYVEAPLELATPQCKVVAFDIDDAELRDKEAPWLPPGYEYFLEADTAAEAVDVVDAWRRETGAPPATARERAAAIIYYAIFDAWLPIGEGLRPPGLQSASELLARYSGRSVPSYEDQLAVRPGDVVEVMVWLAHPDGSRAETRPVRIEAIDGDLITASAVDGDIDLQLRHDHIVGIRR